MATQPGTCPVAFKEWAGVCDALARGRQSIILRKGGIREEPGPGAFVPEHDTFWLYPTAVHQAQQGLRTDTNSDATAGGFSPGPTIPIGFLARVEWVGRVEDESLLPCLEDFHILTSDTVRSRFQYRSPGLWLLATRIYRREPAFAIAATPAHAGCKTWVILDEPLPTAGLVPALEDSEWSTRLARLKSAVGGCEPVPTPG